VISWQTVTVNGKVFGSSEGKTLGSSDGRISSSLDGKTLGSSPCKILGSSDGNTLGSLAGGINVCQMEVVAAHQMARL
jgi:hypothetical protein